MYEAKFYFSDGEESVILDTRFRTEALVRVSRISYMLGFFVTIDYEESTRKTTRLASKNEFLVVELREVAA